MRAFIPVSSLCSSRRISSSRAAEVPGVTGGTRGEGAATGGSQEDNLQGHHKMEIMFRYQTTNVLM